MNKTKIIAYTIFGGLLTFIGIRYLVYRLRLGPTGVSPEPFEPIPLPTLPGTKARIMKQVIEKWGPQIITYAEKYAVSPHLIASTIAVESNGNERASRYEPAFFDRYVKDSKWSHNRSEQEKKNLATSWGLMQVMGTTFLSTKYGSEAYTTPLRMDEILDPDINIDIGVKYLKDQIGRCGDYVGALRAYNTGRCTTSFAGSRYSSAVIGYYESYPADIWSLSLR